MCVREYSNVINVNYTLRWVVADFWWTLRLCSPQQTNRPMCAHNNQSVREMSCSTTCSFRTVLSVKNIGCWARNLTAVRLDQYYYTSRTDGQMKHTRALRFFKTAVFDTFLRFIFMYNHDLRSTCSSLMWWEFEHCCLSHLLIIWAIFITLWMYCSHSWRVLFTPLIQYPMNSKTEFWAL